MNINELKYTSQAELIEIRRNSDIGSEIHIRANEEIQTIQLDTNNKQIGHLSDEFKLNVKSTDRLARYAMYIVLASLISQLILYLISNHQTPDIQRLKI